MVTGSQPYSETCLVHFTMRHTNPWHVHSPRIPALIPDTLSLRLTLFSIIYLKHLTWWSQTTADPSHSARVGNSRVKSLSHHYGQFLWFIFPPYHGTLGSDLQAWKLALEYHHARDLYCHKHCCFMTLDVPYCLGTLVWWATNAFTKDHYGMK